MKTEKSAATTEHDEDRSLQVVFVDLNGRTTNGPLIELPQMPRRVRRLNDRAWNLAETIRRFNMYLESENTAGLESVVRALNRLEGWGMAVDQLLTGPSPNKMKGKALLSFWYSYGLHSIGRGLKGDLPRLIDAFRYLLPPYAGGGLTLYRGEVESRHLGGVYGISWTPIVDKARQFASRRWPDEGVGIVLKIEATPELIVAAVRDHSEHTLSLGEDEYFVDPRLINGRVSVVIS